MSSPASPPAIGAGQVCDRCRAKKIKCNGAVPACASCTSAGTPCIVSAKLRRKTKIRGFQANADDENTRIRTENEQLRASLLHERELNAALQRRIEELSQPLRPHHDSPGHMQTFLHVHQPSASTDSQVSGLNRSALIIKHMGRLVVDDDGHERFAGSTTGVHFILSVQQALHQRNLVRDRFPESCYRLHLLSPMRDGLSLPSTWLASAENGQKLLGRLKDVFNRPLSYFTRQITLFNENWAPLCPIVAESDLIRHIVEVQGNLRHGAVPLSSQSFGHSFQMVVVLLLNASSTGQEERKQEESAGHARLACLMLPQLAATADLTSLQGLALFGLFAQVTGKVLLMPQLNGLLVQIAQLLGLHRHARRFRFSAGQVEMRKRLWWFIYIFDKITSIMLGLPQLILDVDVDVDYPIDCDLEEMETSQLTLPLPGETTQTMEFLAMIYLGRILAEILEQLYTTTRRRRGPEKIAKLHTDLLNWRQRFRNYSSDICEAGPSGQPLLRLWIPVMESFAMVLIHRPGLTFDDKTQQFRDSLDQCAGACSTIINLACTPLARTSVLGIMPIGPSMLLQCGLMHILYQSYSLDHSSAGNRISPDSSEELVQRVIDLFSQYKPAHAVESTFPGVHSQSFMIAMSEASQLLRSLSQAVLRTTSNAPIMAEAQSGSSLPSANLTLENIGYQPMSLDAGNDSGSLENLNHLDFMNWMFDNPFNTLPNME